MRIFLDVGANRGQTISRVLEPRYRIDRVFGFEPSPRCSAHLSLLFADDPRVVVIAAGLWRSTCEMKLYNEGGEGGTIHADYRSALAPEPGAATIRCRFVRASEWFAGNLSGGDEVFLKLNCEGSECDIVNDLLDSGEYAKVRATLIDFDVRKSPSQARQEAALRARLASLGIANVHIYMGRRRHRILRRVLR